MKKVYVCITLMIVFFLPVALLAQNLSKHGSENPFGHQDLQTRYEWNADGNVLYRATAAPGRMTSTARWQIIKYFYDDDGNITRGVWADQTNQYNKVWNDRDTYDYFDN